MYQMGQGLLRARSRSTAAGDAVMGARPGGQLRPFWMQLKATSTPLASTLMGIAPSEVTQSTMVIAPTACEGRVIADKSCSAPVEVSACTKATAWGFSRFKNSEASVSVKVSPQGLLEHTTFAP